MLGNRKDMAVLRELAEQYAELAARPIQDQRRKLWSAHLSLKKTRPLVLATYGMWNVWCREVFGDPAMKCEEPFYREHERFLRMQIFHDAVGDDYILEPWITQHAALKGRGGIFGEAWGVDPNWRRPGVEGGAWKAQAPIQSWDDVKKLIPPRHEIDEAETRRLADALKEAVGDRLEVDVNRDPLLMGFGGDISTTLGGLRGIEQFMIDMYESPRELHGLLALLRDGILANQDAAERAGDLSLTSHSNQAMPYSDELEWFRPNSGPRQRSQLWGFCAAQEFTLVSPQFHDEFLYQYQMPIMARYGLVHYGCCEDLTRKIAMLRQLKNLRSIAATPRADVKKCAEQIGADYVISWRPNPTDMVCAGWDEGRIRKIIGEGLSACRDGFVHVHLKDVETVQGETDRLARWTAIVRDIAEAF